MFIQLALMEVKINFVKVLNFDKVIETNSRKMNNKNTQTFRYKSQLN